MFAKLKSNVCVILASFSFNISIKSSLVQYFRGFTLDEISPEQWYYIFLSMHIYQTHIYSFNLSSTLNVYASPLPRYRPNKDKYSVQAREEIRTDTQTDNRSLQAPTPTLCRQGIKPRTRRNNLNALLYYEAYNYKRLNNCTISRNRNMHYLRLIHTIQ